MARVRPFGFRFALGAAAMAAVSASGAGAQAFRPGPKIGPPPAREHAAADPALRAAVESSLRPAGDRARDVFRHPVETLTFWGLKPGMTVVDLQPGGGYWTAILAPYLKATGGRYVAGGSPGARDAFLAKWGDPAKFGRVEYVAFGKAPGAIAPAGSVDLIITSREIHNWIDGEYLDRAMADAFAALKPGGVLAVEEHRADPKPEAPKASTGYVAVRTVVEAARRAGFRFEDASEINSNPRDTKDHPFGVWTLPPTRQSSAGQGQPSPPGFDRARYDAVGESDRMTLRLRKP